MKHLRSESVSQIYAKSFFDLYAVVEFSAELLVDLYVEIHGGSDK